MNPALYINQTWLQCMRCGKRADILAERLFECPDCGGLFDVEHDFSGIGDVSLLKEEFGARMADFNHMNGAVGQSGVWRYRELIMPHLPKEHIVSLAEGNVPILHAGKNLCRWIGNNNVWIILEGMTPTGSFKDFGMTVLVSIAKAAGIRAIACASTGDTSGAVGAYAAAAGMTSVVVLPFGKVTPVQLVQSGIYGSIVITLPGNFDACMTVMKELVTDYGVYPANSLNPARIEGHQATAFQIADFFDWEMPSWIALPVGNGSDCSSVGKGMRLLKRFDFVPQTSRILGCQSEAACPLASSWQKNAAAWASSYHPMLKLGDTTATAARIGEPVSASKVMREISASNGAMQIASEYELNEGVAVCGSDGIFVCPQTGTAIAGARNAVRNGTIGKDETVVIVSTATGLKFTESAARHLEGKIINLDTVSTAAVAKILHL